MTSLPPDIIQAYITAEYRVLGDEPFLLEIGHFSEHLADLYRSLDVHSAAFLTAYNPGGALATDSENRAVQQHLLRVLESLALTWLPAFGADPIGVWPGEQSVLAIGLCLDQATQLGRQFNQNAIVWIGDDAVPRLVLLH